MEQRFSRLMETAGLSVLVVAITNVVAFGLGAITTIPAIHWCVSMVLAVLWLPIVYPNHPSQPPSVAVPNKPAAVTGYRADHGTWNPRSRHNSCQLSMLVNVCPTKPTHPLRAQGLSFRVPTGRFCIYATICVATNFVALSTFFLATFVLSERRIAANKLDLLCCYTSKKTRGFIVEDLNPPELATSAGL